MTADHLQAAATAPSSSSLLGAALDYVLPAAAASGLHQPKQQQQQQQPWGSSPASPTAANDDGDDERLAAANFRLFDLNAEARDALARQQRPGGRGRGVGAARGRVGPPAVGVDLASATPFLTVSTPADDGGLAPLSLESAQGFSSCRANAAALSGRWQYEVVLRSHGILQLGWCQRDTPFTVNNGVGDAPDSYAYDGKRMKRWSVRARTYGRPWAAGDVIGCCIDLSPGEPQHAHHPHEPATAAVAGGAEQQQQQQQPGAGAGGAASGSGAVPQQQQQGAEAGQQQPQQQPQRPQPPPPHGTITFYRNGVSLGTAFTSVRVLLQGAAYFPGLSLSQGERCDVNFGQTPFVYPVAGHSALQAPPPPAAQAYFRAVTVALARLLVLRLRHGGGGGGGGCGQAGGASAGGGGGDGGVSAEEAAAVEARLRDFVREALSAGAVCAAEAHAHAAGGSIAEQRAAGDAAAAAAAGAAPDAADAAPAWPGDDAFALLAGLVGDHVLWLVDHSEWWLHAHLLPLALRAHGLEPPHAGGALRALVRLCQLALPPDGFGRFVAALGRVLAHYASMAPFQRPEGAAAAAAAGQAPGSSADGGDGSGGASSCLDAWGMRPAPGVFAATGFSRISQLAFTGAYPFTAALAAVVRLPDAAAAWAYGRQWLPQMEAVLSRKLPTLDDLKDLMPHVPRFAPGNGSGSGGGGNGGAPRMRVHGGEAFRADVRQLTAAMRGIEANQMALAAAAADAAPPVGAGSSSSSSSSSAPPLLRLVRHVLRRNRYIASSSPPPGLSDGTVLTSLFYLLLRMLRPYVAGARPSRSLRHFPAGRMFVHSTAAAEPPRPAGGVGPLTSARRAAAAAAQPPDDGVGEVLSDLVRVGGLASHLRREAPVADAVLARHGGGRVDVPEWSGRGGGAGGDGGGGDGGSKGAAARNGDDDDDDDEVEAPALADEWLPELLAAAVVLYTWRVSGSVQSGTAMAGVMEANIGGMQELSELERMLEGGGQQQGGADGGGNGGAGGGQQQAGGGPMAAARSTVQGEVESSTRYVAITQVVLFSGWKAGALLAAAAYVVAMLAALAAVGGAGPGGAAGGSNAAGEAGGSGSGGSGGNSSDMQQGEQQQGGGGGGSTGADDADADERRQLSRLLLYAPTAFVSAPLELLLALQAAASPFSAASARLSEAQLAAFVGFVVACLCDGRVVHPDVRELIMRALSTLLESPGCIAAMERHPAAVASLVPRLMGSFSGEHWQEVALALLRLVGGAGMGELVEPPADGGAAAAAAAAAAVGGGSNGAPVAPRSSRDWRQRLVAAQRADSAGAALTVVEAVAEHVNRERAGAAGVSLDDDGDAAGAGAAAGRPSSGSDVFRASFGRYASAHLDDAARFLGQLYDSLNAVLTEGASLVVELHRAVGLAPARAVAPPMAGGAGGAAAVADASAAAAAADGEGGGEQQEAGGAGAGAGAAAGAAPPAAGQQPRQPPPPERLSQSQLQQRYRRAAALVDVSIALLRLLEATARDAPAVFLCGATAPLAMARLIELLSFVMRHYCAGAEARRLSELLRQRSLTIQRQRRAGSGGAGGGGAGARGAAFAGGGALGNFSVPLPGIGNLTFLVHADGADAAPPPGAAGADADEEGGANGEPSPVERLARAAVLAPVAGIILNLAMAERLPDADGSGGSAADGAGACVRSTAALVGAKQPRARPEALCPPGAPRRRSFVEQLAASDVPLEALRSLLGLDWLQLEASRRLLRPERTAGAVAGLLLQDSADLRSARERRRSRRAAPLPPAGDGSPQPMDVDDAGASAPDAAGDGHAAAGAGAAGFGGEPGPALRRQLELLRGVLDAVAARRAALRNPASAGPGAPAGAGGAAAGAGAAAGGAGAGAAPPDEFLDPLTAALMEDPVILPNSRMVVDRSTIAR